MVYSNPTHRTRPGVASLMRATGALVCFTGFALLYGLSFGGYPVWVQATTPFLFPAAALALAITLHRRGCPAWEVELAAATGYLASASPPRRRPSFSTPGRGPVQRSASWPPRSWPACTGWCESSG